jgi:hypothetical protein
VYHPRGEDLIEEKCLSGEERRGLGSRRACCPQSSMLLDPLLSSKASIDILGKSLVPVLCEQFLGTVSNQQTWCCMIVIMNRKLFVVRDGGCVVFWNSILVGRFFSMGEVTFSRYGWGSGAVNLLA